MSGKAGAALTLGTATAIGYCNISQPKFSISLVSHNSTVAIPVPLPISPPISPVESFNVDSYLKDIEEKKARILKDNSPNQ